MAANKENDEATKLEKRIRAVEAIKAKLEYIGTAALPNQPEEIHMILCAANSDYSS